MPVAQLDRASASGAEGRAFESPQARFVSIQFETLYYWMYHSMNIMLSYNRIVCQGRRNDTILHFTINSINCNKANRNETLQCDKNETFLCNQI